MSDLYPYLGALLVLGTMAATWAARLGHASRHQAPTATVFTAHEPGTRWLACHATRCAHMTTRHRPTADGAWTCTGCGTTTGGEA
ncbi:hypothetical protein OG292_03045 [Streptomyces sp. NBC_01511]|uniref:hypothetical protein n=1 Tax=Streptomyces sp. NBC_01511 TaxID=2903889 RepID=UPI00386760E7